MTLTKIEIKETKKYTIDINTSTERYEFELRGDDFHDLAQQTGMVAALVKTEWNRMHLATDDPNACIATVERQVALLVALDQKIEAIKIIRQTTRCGLKEAKDAVELMQEAMFPGRFVRRINERKERQDFPATLTQLLTR